jgi:hypothetical protein
MENILEGNKYNMIIEYILQQDCDTINGNIKLTPEVKKYFLFLCKEQPSLFGVIEESLKKIILDDKIDAKDIPELINVVSNIYNVIKHKENKPQIDIYDLIKTLIHFALFVYIETNKIKNVELLDSLMKIVDISIELIKIQPEISKKIRGCVGCL